MATMKNSDLPASFADALHPNYLGSPTVVERILGEFLTDIVGWIHARGDGEMTADEMTGAAYARGVDFAAIFSGDNKDYRAIVGWNSRAGGLGATLMADLGSYWQSQRAACGDGPYRVLFSWLVWATFEAMKFDDDILTPMRMGENIQKVTRMLTGTDKRA